MDDDKRIALQLDLETREVRATDPIEDEPYVPTEPRSQAETPEQVAERQRRWEIRNLEELATTQWNLRDKAKAEADQLEKRFGQLDPIPELYNLRYELMTQARAQRKLSQEHERAASGLHALADRLRSDPTVSVTDIRRRYAFRFGSDHTADA